jgi:hypothetical protein
LVVAVLVRRRQVSHRVVTQAVSVERTWRQSRLLAVVVVLAEALVLVSLVQLVVLAVAVKVLGMVLVVQERHRLCRVTTAVQVSTLDLLVVAVVVRVRLAILTVKEMVVMVCRRQSLVLP